MNVITPNLSHHTTHSLVGALCLIITSAATLNAAEKVIIKGGIEQDGAYYRWQVTNYYASPIVRIEFPQYGADIFEIPPKWQTGTVKEMNLVNVGWNPRKAGLCFAIPTPPNPGLMQGATCNFSMRVPPSVTTLPSHKTVHIVFTDETTFDVANVELPTKVEGSPRVMLVGVAGLFVLCVVILEMRKRRARHSAENDPSAPQS